MLFRSVEESYRPVFGFRVLFEIGHVKHASDRGRVLGFLGLIEEELAAGLGLAIQAQLRILRIGGAHGEGAGNGGVGNVLAGGVDRALGNDFGGRHLLGGLVGGFVGGGRFAGRRIVCSTGECRQAEKRSRKQGGGEAADGLHQVVSRSPNRGEESV